MSPSFVIGYWLYLFDGSVLSANIYPDVGYPSSERCSVSALMFSRRVTVVAVLSMRHSHEYLSALWIRLASDHRQERTALRGVPASARRLIASSTSTKVPNVLTMLNIYCYYGAGVQVCDRKPSVRKVLRLAMKTRYDKIRLQNGSR
jgi:hypothetical protein